MRRSLQAEAGVGGSSDGDDDDGGSGGGGAASPAHLGLKQWWARDILEEGALGHGEVYTLTADELKSLETDAEGIEQQLLQVRGVCERESARVEGGRRAGGVRACGRKEGERKAAAAAVWLTTSSPLPLFPSRSSWSTRSDLACLQLLPQPRRHQRRWPQQQRWPSLPFRKLRHLVTQRTGSRRTAAQARCTASSYTRCYEYS